MLTQPQRIEISKKIVSIPREIQSAEQAKILIQTVDLPKAQELDNGNKSLIDQRKPMIDGYQAELQMLDGNGRTVLVEQDYLDASARLLANKFFYNQPSVPTPSMPDGVWKNLLPFFGGFGVGKNYSEAYSVVQKEQDLIDAFNAAVTAFEVFHPMERCTGQRAVTNPSPPPTDLIETYPAVQTALTNLVTAVNNYDAFLTSQSSIIYTSDSNLTRQIQSTTAKSNIDTVIKPAIALWLSYTNYNTSHGQTSIAGFYAYNTALLAPTKGNPLQLDVLKAAVSARKTFIDSTRRPQLESYLGSVTQAPNGEITAQAGLYGERALAIVLRLNTIGGSLANIEGLKKAISAQDNIIQSGNLSSQAYDLALKASKFIAPANGTKSIHVGNSGIFSVGDSVFVCGDGQAELSGTIVQIAGTRIDLDFEVPQKYTALNNSRLYKVI